MRRIIVALTALAVGVPTLWPGDAAARASGYVNPNYHYVRPYDRRNGTHVPGPRLCGNGLEIAVLGDSALGASALESRSLGLWGLGDASVHRWRRSDATGAATAQP